MGVESHSHNRSRLTIVARLALMAAIGVASVALVGAAAYWGSAASDISGTVTHITASSGSTADSANTTRRSAERVSAAAGEIRGLIGQFTY
jgi:methyl-accepting chemotaxis protein